jgi:16S rRNA (cytosine967-C5)-methyltransferase
MRREIFEIYSEVSRKKGYLNVMIQNSDKITPQMTNILYQTVRNQLLIDYIIESKVGKSKIKSKTRDILRLGACEILLTKNKAAFAIVNDWVEISKECTNQFEANKVNSILRNLIDISIEDEVIKIKNKKKQISIKYSIPSELLEYLQKKNGIQGVQTMTKIMENKIINYARINRKLVDNIKLLLNELEEYSPRLIEEFIIEYKGDITQSNAFKEGKLYIQNISAYMAFEKGIFKKSNMKVMDMCGAPGGKTSHIYDQLTGNNSIVINEINENKNKKIHNNLERQKIKNYSITNLNALNLVEEYGSDSFDIVVLDTPCSGLGVVGHKPDIKYSMTKDKIDTLVELQKKLIDVAVKLIKPGGFLVYSTCTINRMENQEITNKFNVIEEDLLTISDGFYYAVIVK